MLRKKLLLIAALISAWSALHALPAAAQFHDCGNECRVCGDSKWEGQTHATNGPYNMMCIGPTEEAGCAGCSSPSASAKGIDAMTIAKVVEAASARELGAVVAGYGDRLLLNAARNILVIKGTGCDPEALGTVVFLSPTKARAFARLKTAGLQKFLAASSAKAQAARAGA